MEENKDTITTSAARVCKIKVLQRERPNFKMAPILATSMNHERNS